MNKKDRCDKIRNDDSKASGLIVKGGKRKRTLKEYDNLFCNADNKKKLCTRREEEKEQKCDTEKEIGLENIQEKKAIDYMNDFEDKQEQKDLNRESWRSRCGRKRKYFGQASARQGATSRERNRFQGMTKALEALKQLIPKAQQPTYGKLSKYATLKLAARYIAVLTDALKSIEKMEDGNQSERNQHSALDQWRSSSEKTNETNHVCSLEKDELFTGDFTDVMFDDYEKIDDAELLFNEVTKQSFGLFEIEGTEFNHALSHVN